MRGGTSTNLSELLVVCMGWLGVLRCVKNSGENGNDRPPSPPPRAVIITRNVLPTHASKQWRRVRDVDLDVRCATVCPRPLRRPVQSSCWRSTMASLSLICPIGTVLENGFEMKNRKTGGCLVVTVPSWFVRFDGDVWDHRTWRCVTDCVWLRVGLW